MNENNLMESTMTNTAAAPGSTTTTATRSSTNAITNSGCGVGSSSSSSSSSGSSSSSSSAAAASAGSSTFAAVGATTTVITRKVILRKGKWTVEEEAYTNAIIHAFNHGLLNLARGVTLRSYLSEKLWCDPMRITKKFSGASCIGKQVYTPCDVNEANRLSAEQTAQVLAQLEEIMLLKLHQCEPFYPSRANMDKVVEANLLHVQLPRTLEGSTEESLSELLTQIKQPPAVPVVSLEGDFISRAQQQQHLMHQCARLQAIQIRLAAMRGGRPLVGPGVRPLSRIAENASSGSDKAGTSGEEGAAYFTSSVSSLSSSSSSSSSSFSSSSSSSSSFSSSSSSYMPATADQGFDAASLECVSDATFIRASADRRPSGRKLAASSPQHVNPQYPKQASESQPAAASWSRNQARNAAASQAASAAAEGKPAAQVDLDASDLLLNFFKSTTGGPPSPTAGDNEAKCDEAGESGDETSETSGDRQSLSKSSSSSSSSEGSEADGEVAKGLRGKRSREGAPSHHGLMKRTRGSREA